MALSRARTASSTLFKSLLQPPALLSIISNNSAFRNFSNEAGNAHSLRENMTRQLLQLDFNSQIGSCMPLGAMRIGTIIHNIEMNPGQGGKLVRAAGTCAKILKEPTSSYCLVKLTFWC